MARDVLGGTRERWRIGALADAGGDPTFRVKRSGGWSPYMVLLTDESEHLFGHVRCVVTDYTGRVTEPFYLPEQAWVTVVCTVRCPSCGGSCTWADDEWYCQRCGDEWHHDTILRGQADDDGGA